MRLELGTFVRQYARKKTAGHDPNDRKYDRQVERLVRTMPPDELDQLLRDETPVLPSKRKPRE